MELRTCCRVAAAPVGLFGEQKKIRSVRRICTVDRTTDEPDSGHSSCRTGPDLALILFGGQE